MAIDLLNIKPHQVSRDMRGYTVFLYGEPKSGKTTTATKFPRHLLFAFEKGYNAIPGAMAQPINSWAEFKKALRQLKDAQIKEQFETIIIDTVDIAYSYCEKYVCTNYQKSDGTYGVDSVSDIPFGKGYTLVGQEFDESLRTIAQLDYGLVMISHATDKVFKDESGKEYNRIVPTLDKRAKNIVSRMVDLYGYSRIVTDNEGKESTKLFLRGTSRYEAGSRFKYTPDYIDFNYSSLVSAIGEAIDKQAAEDGGEYFTDARQNLYEDTTNELDFDQLMSVFRTTIEMITDKVSEEAMASEWAPRITQIIEKYLGKGAKVGDMSRDQTEALSLIVDDLAELCNKNFS